MDLTTSPELASAEHFPIGHSRYLPFLLVLFFGSGCSALIYEVTWYQVLQLTLGSTSVSLGILLATFMGGLCIGSIALPRLNLKGAHPLRVFAGLELSIGILGVVVTTALPLLSYLYVAGAVNAVPGLLLRGAVAAIGMLPSTLLMGASLPAVVRWIEATPRGVSWWALLYGGNTAGAVFGCLLAGFYLLRVYNIATAAYVAAVINLIVAALSFVLAANTPPQISADVAHPGSLGPPQSFPEDRRTRWTVYFTIALSGAAALGAEVVWTRLMATLLLATVYVFSIILAVFLVGLAVGGFTASWLMRKTRARVALGWCQMLLVAGFVWTAVLITQVLPYAADDILTTSSPPTMFVLDLKRCLIAILPPSVLWGASFPLACAAAVRSPDEDPGRVAGGIYAANTLGGIVGALTVSLILIPSIGSQHTQQLLAAVSAVSALVILAPLVTNYLVTNYKSATGAVAACLVAVVAVVSVPPVPGDLIAYGRRMSEMKGQSQILYVAEGRNSSVAVSRWRTGTLYLNVNGHVEATTEAYDMKLQRMVAHLPGVLHSDPKSILGIGFGAGVSAGAFTRYPGIQKITVCEIEPVIPPASTRFFNKQNYDVYHDPRTHIVYDDARHFLLTTTEKYDIIASDPLDVFVKGTAALYSKEYFESVKRRLNPGGYFSLYVPLYETDEPTIRSELETFLEAFPNGTAWANTRDGHGYDMVFMGQVDQLRINITEMQQRINRADYVPVLDSLRDVGVNSAYDLFGTYAGQKSDIGRWTKGAQINHDSDLRLSYLAGWGINADSADYLYRQLLTYRREPTNIFIGTPEKLHMLDEAIARQ